MKLLVIGSSGGVARRVIPILRDSISNLCITGVDLTPLNPPNVDEFIVFDLNVCKEFSVEIPRDLSVALRQADAVVFLAAAVHERSITLGTYQRLNVLAPTVLLSEYIQGRNTSGTFIYFSSIAVYGESFEIANENSPLLPATAYAASKAEAEARLASAAQEGVGVYLSIVRPGTVISRDDRGNLRKLIGLAERRRVFFSVKSGISKSFVDVEDLGRLLHKILENPDEKAGIYNAAGPAVDLQEILSLVSSVTQPVLQVPLTKGLLRRLSPTMANSVSVDSSKAEREFGFRFNSFRNVFLREFGS
ncbi:MAG: NAD(P)-dependent oxidoreductase [Spirochaeta sp.]|nr:NAD(P)-dependent oxidoreductase [Spirochaeta sp.]